VLCSLVAREMFKTFYILYSMGYATMLASTYMVPVQLGWKTNQEWRGLIIGVIIGGFGLGPLIFNNVSAKIVNPRNLPQVLISEEPELYAFPDEIALRVPQMFQTLAIYYSALVIISIIFIQESKP